MINTTTNPIQPCLFYRVAQFSDVERLAEETGCLPSYIAKGISMGCFYYARCLQEGHGVRRNEAEAKRYYSKVTMVTLNVLVKD